MSSESIVESNNQTKHFHDAAGDGLSDAMIRGNMQYVNGELKKIPRPLNAFMIFSNEKRKELKKEFPGEPNNMISSRLGAAWKALSDEARKRYHDMAHREDLEHRRKYPNYQYCPGHARKLKKARREQRLRQQSSSYRATRASQMKSARLASTDVKQETGELSPSQKRHPQQILHGIMGQMGAVPGPHGEGSYGGYMHPMNPAESSVMCCCTQCKMMAADMYGYCAESWGASESAGAVPYPAAPQHQYPGPGSVVYLPCDAQYAAEKLGWPSPAEMMQQSCMLGPECAGCYSHGGYMQSTDACCSGTQSQMQHSSAPHHMYTAGGDNSSMMYKDMCFMPSEMPTGMVPSVQAMGAGMSVADREPDLMDISNNTVSPPGQLNSNPASASNSVKTTSCRGTPENTGEEQEIIDQQSSAAIVCKEETPDQ